MSAFTDDDVQAAEDAVDALYDDGEPHEHEEELRAVLAAVAPAIAARALREFATDRVVHQTPARLIEDMFARADEIERTH
jgi:hypothetical protein